MGTVAHPYSGFGFWAQLLASKAFPEFLELLMQFGIVQIAKPFACYHDNVQTTQ